MNYEDTLQYIGQGWSDSAHNLVLDSWLRGGVLAAVFSLVFVVSLCISMPRRFGVAGLLGLAIIPYLMFGSQLLFIDSREAAVVLALVGGIALAIGGSVGADDGENSPTLGRL